MIQRNLRLDTQYTILSSWYQSLEDGGNTCENCGRLIANCCEVQNTEGRKFTMGMDCAATLSGITDTYALSAIESSFREGKAARAKIVKFQKSYPLGELRIETLPEGTGYYKEADSGIISCSFRPEQGQSYYTMKQYPASVWIKHVLPMVQSFAN